MRQTAMGGTRPASWGVTVLAAVACVACAPALAPPEGVGATLVVARLAFWRSPGAIDDLPEHATKGLILRIVEGKSGMVTEARSDAAGLVWFTDLPPGSYRVGAWAFDPDAADGLTTWAGGPLGAAAGAPHRLQPGQVLDFGTLWFGLDAGRDAWAIGVPGEPAWPHFVSRHAAARQWPSPRRERADWRGTLRVQILVTDDLRRAWGEDWRAEAVARVRMASRVYEAEVGYRLEAVRVESAGEEWPAVRPSQALDVVRRWPPPTADFRVAFIPHIPRGKGQRVAHGRGASAFLGRDLVVAARAPDALGAAWSRAEDGLVLAHELAHALGAVHVSDVPSLMAPEVGIVTRFDPDTRALVAAMAAARAVPGTAPSLVPAVAAYRALLAHHLDPEARIQAALGLGLAALAAGEARTAVTALEEAARDRASDPAVALALGDAHRLAGEPEAARESYERALRFGPSPAIAVAVAERLSSLEERIRGRAARD